jgi:hypothetical protein
MQLHSMRPIAVALVTCGCADLIGSEFGSYQVERDQTHDAGDGAGGSSRMNLDAGELGAGGAIAYGGSSSSAGGARTSMGGELGAGGNAGGQSGRPSAGGDVGAGDAATGGQLGAGGAAAPFHGCYECDPNGTNDCGTICGDVGGTCTSPGNCGTCSKTTGCCTCASTTVDVPTCTSSSCPDGMLCTANPGFFLLGVYSGRGITCGSGSCTTASPGPCTPANGFVCCLSPSRTFNGTDWGYCGNACP